MSNGVFFIFLVVVSAFAFFIIIESARLTWRMFISRRMTNSIKKFERHNPAAAQRILFIGDSTGHGTGTSHERYSVVGRLGADFPDAHIENHSKTGLALSQACQILRAKAAAKQPEPFDVVIIMVGGINLVYCTPLALVCRMLRSAIAYSKQCGRETVLISPNNAGLAPLYRFPLARLYQKRAKQFSAIYRDIAHEERIHHVSLFQEHSDQLSANNLFSPDKAHPNDEGYGLWYNQMKETIAATLKNHA